MNQHMDSQQPIMTINIPFFQYPVPDKRNFALYEVNFNVHAMDSIAILGESGSGKSTLLKILAGLLDLQKKNQVCMLSSSNNLTPLANIPRKPRYGRLQIVFQDNMGSLYEKETIQSSLKHIARIKKQKEKTVFSTAQQFFEDLRLISHQASADTKSSHPDTETSHLDSFQTFMKKQVVQLSMGMLRRFCLAKSLLLLDIYEPHQQVAPKVLLVDEISRGLDQDTKKELIAFLLEVRKRYHLSIIAISHELDFLKEFCHDFYFLFEGLMIPRCYTQNELSLENCHQIDNVYLKRYFIPCEEPDQKNKTSQQLSTGCYFQQFYDCPEASSRCQTSNIQKETPWICS